jgi:hypothetical protein
MILTAVDIIQLRTVVQSVNNFEGCELNQVEDEMGGTCRTNGGRRGKRIDYSWESQRETDH